MSRKTDNTHLFLGTGSKSEVLRYALFLLYVWFLDYVFLAVSPAAGWQHLLFCVRPSAPQKLFKFPHNCSHPKTLLEATISRFPGFSTGSEVCCPMIKHWAETDYLCVSRLVPAFCFQSRSRALQAMLSHIHCPARVSQVILLPLIAFK